MSDVPAARWHARAWALLVATSALYFLTENEADNDLWMHLYTGRLIVGTGTVPRADDLSYTAAGLPWIDHEWLTQAAFATVFDAMGSTGLWMGKLAVALLTAWLVWLPVARRSRSPWVRGPVMVLALATLARGYAIRPQIITYLGVAALLAWLDYLDGARRRPAAWTLIALTAAGFALWANAHGGFIVGLGVLALFVIVPGRPLHDARPSPPSPVSPPAVPSPLMGEGPDGGLVRDDSRPLAAPLRAGMLITALLAACLNPYGPSLFAYILAELRVPHPLSEWQPVHVGDPAHVPFLFLLAALIATLPFARTLRRRPWWAALVVIVAVMAIRHQRHIPLFALCAAAPLTEQVDAALAWLRARTRFRLSAAARTTIAVAAVGLALAQLGVLAERIWRARGGVVYAAGEYPVGALRFLRAHHVHGNLALPLDWGGYAIWHGAPDVRVSMDGRFATVYSPRVVEDNFAFYRGDAGSDAARLLDAYDTTLVLVPRGVSTPLEGRPGWQLLYADGVAALFGATGAQAAGASEAPRGWLAFP